MLEWTLAMKWVAVIVDKEGNVLWLMSVQRMQSALKRFGIPSAEIDWAFMDLSLVQKTPILNHNYKPKTYIYIWPLIK